MIFSNGQTSDNYKRIDLGNVAHITIFNDSVGNQLSFSIDGATEIGFMYNEGIEFRDINLDTIYVKSKLAGAHCLFRIWGYGNRNVIYDKANRQFNSPDVPQTRQFIGGQNTYGKDGL